MTDWKTVPQFPDYRVSDRGEVQSRKSGDWRAMTPGKFWATEWRNPYLKVALSAGGVKRSFNVHALVLTLFGCDRPAGMQCRHLNGDASDNRIENLCWGTPSENSRDMDRHGTRRTRKGEAHRDAKLSDALVTRMRLDWLAGDPDSTIARRYGVSKQAAARAVRGETWRAVPMPHGPRRACRRGPLTADERAGITLLVNSGSSQREAAEAFGVDPSCVSRVLKPRPSRSGAASATR